ncbi:MAG: TetR/AcrR family transcriptional regulator [Bacteroidales bacterium]|nr:TetR/AcrR family transcriptional regulator [Bacteroidales bacterium]
MTEILTEEKIKEAARIVFMEKGYAATGMRDIAAKAGVNLSLVNYYFRSKRNIFNLIMTEKMQKIFGSIIPYMMDETTSLEEKIKNISTMYINTISEDPNLPLFVFSEIQKNPEEFAFLFPLKQINFMETSIIKQFKIRCPNINPAHFMLNFLGMTIFPFIAAHLFSKTQTHIFDNILAVIEERKTLIPLWMNQILDSPINLNDI